MHEEDDCEASGVRLRRGGTHQRQEERLLPHSIELPAAAIRRLREAGMYGSPEIASSSGGPVSGTFPRSQSGGAQQIGRYVRFVANRDNGCRGFCGRIGYAECPARDRDRSRTRSVEMFRIEHSYIADCAASSPHSQGRLATHDLNAVCVSRLAGTTPVELVEKDGVAGRSAPVSVEQGSPGSGRLFFGRGSGRNLWVKLWAMRTFPLLNCAKRWRWLRYRRETDLPRTRN